MNSAHFLTPLTTQERKRTKIQPQKQSLCPLNAVIVKEGLPDLLKTTCVP